MPEHSQDIPERFPDLSEGYSGFLSYARQDDRHEKGRITHLREQIEGEFELQTGIRFRIFQDKATLRGGDVWRDRIARAISGAQIFIPIVTPSFLNSGPCREELEQFRSCHADSQTRIIPISYVDLPDWIPRDDPLVATLARFQRIDFREARFFEYDSPDYRRTIANLVQQIVGGLGEISPHTPITEYERLASDGSFRERRTTQMDDQRTSVFVEAALCSVYVLQSTVGKSCVETVQYRLHSIDGIELISDPIELREGLYNISAAFWEAERDTEGRDYIKFAALDDRGTGRTLSLEILGLPDHCSAASEALSADLLSGVDTRGRAIFRMDISCDCPSS